MNFIIPYADLIEKEIRDLDFPAKPETLYEPQRYILEGEGKRIRPVLVLMGCGICGGDIEDALPAGVAVELIHNFTLIHDDIMDQAENRRGRPSVHVKWNVPAAILAGDGIYVQALLQLHKLPDTIDFKALTRTFLHGINHVCEGQALDMEFQERFDVSVEEYINMIHGKTAALISVALQIGGFVSGASPEKIKQLGELGQSLGIAFQIQDDLLDVIADPEKFGKKRGGDISEGKKTFLMVKTLERCNKTEKDWLVQCLKNRPVNKKNIQQIIELYQKYGITESAQELLTIYYKKADEILTGFDDSDYKRDLSKFITYLQKRDF